MRLGVVDQSPVPTGATAADALANSIDLARRCDALGYHRYWVAEHHNSDGLAGSAPEILVDRIATATSTIRVGSGGVMLSHYSPYKVAETFRTLAALHPGRIDLGVGRAPGSDPITMYALAAGDQLRPLDHYPSMVRELVGFLSGALPDDSPFRGRVRAVPTAVEPAPPVWLLASSPDSASFAAHLGLPLSWAHFISVDDGPAIVAAYRRQYQPSEAFPEPQVNVAVGAICAETDEEAHRQASSIRLWRQRGLAGPIPSVDEAVARVGAQAGDTQADEAGRRKPLIVGSPVTVRARIDALAEAYQTDDVLVVTIVWDHGARVRSHELLAEAYDLGRRQSTSG